MRHTRPCRNPRCGEILSAFDLSLFGFCPSCAYVGRRAWAIGFFVGGFVFSILIELVLSPALLAWLSE